MKLLFKLGILIIGIGFLASVLQPNTPVGSVVNAAISDARAFCERNPAACEQTNQLAHRAGDLIAAVYFTIRPKVEEATALTKADRALVPPAQTAPPQLAVGAPAAANGQQPAIATHSQLPKP